MLKSSQDYADKSRDIFEVSTRSSRAKIRANFIIFVCEIFARSSRDLAKIFARSTRDLCEIFARSLWEYVTVYRKIFYRLWNTYIFIGEIYARSLRDFCEIFSRYRREITRNRRDIVGENFVWSSWNFVGKSPLNRHELSIIISVVLARIVVRSEDIARYSGDRREKNKFLTINSKST